MVREGDFVEIPLPDGRVAIARIIHVSQYFKNAVGFVVYGIAGTLLTTELHDLLGSERLGPLYTHIDAIGHYGWKVIGHHPISEADRKLTTRRVAGDVYVGDDCVGPVADLRCPDLKPMLGMGMPVVYHVIQKEFPRGTM